mgnify:CR=1 FL=1
MNKKGHKICVVEDDISIRELIRFNLESEGYSVVAFEHGEEMFDYFEKFDDEISLFVLDVMLPGDDGFQLCRALRGLERFALSSFLMLTARSAEQDKLLGFSSGADDYLTKPFGMRELLARVRALVKRYEERCSLSDNEPIIIGSGDNDDESKADADDKVPHDGIYRVGPIVLDQPRYTVTFYDEEVEMTHREFELLLFFMRHTGFVFKREQLLDQVWGFDYPGETRTVDAHVRNLRRKFEEHDIDPAIIETVRGVGYRMRDMTPDGELKS